MKILLILLLSFTSVAQIPYGRYKMDLRVKRVPLNYDSIISEQYENVTFLYYPDSVRLITYLEEISLTKQKYTFYVYTQGAQHWYVQTYNQDLGIIIFVIPLKPYTRKLHAIILKSW